MEGELEYALANVIEAKAYVKEAAARNIESNQQRNEKKVKILSSDLGTNKVKRTRTSKGSKSNPRKDPDVEKKTEPINNVVLKRRIFKFLIVNPRSDLKTIADNVRWTPDEVLHHLRAIADSSSSGDWIVKKEMFLDELFDRTWQFTDEEKSILHPQLLSCRTLMRVKPGNAFWDYVDTFDLSKKTSSQQSSVTNRSGKEPNPMQNGSSENPEKSLNEDSVIDVLQDSDDTGDRKNTQEVTDASKVIKRKPAKTEDNTVKKSPVKKQRTVEESKEVTPKSKSEIPKIPASVDLFGGPIIPKNRRLKRPGITQSPKDVLSAPKALPQSTKETVLSKTLAEMNSPKPEKKVLKTNVRRGESDRLEIFRMNHRSDDLFRSMENSNHDMNFHFEAYDKETDPVEKSILKRRYWAEWEKRGGREKRNAQCEEINSLDNARFNIMATNIAKHFSILE